MPPAYHDAHTRLKAGTTPFLENGACSRPPYATMPRIVSSVEGCSNMSPDVVKLVRHLDAKWSKQGKSTVLVDLLQKLQFS